MIKFDEIDENRMLDIIDKRTELSIKISDDLTKFSKDFPNVDFSREREIPPTAIILTREGLAEIILHTTHDIRGRFTRFVVFVYAFNGRIFYKSLGNGEYEAKVVWEKT